MEASSVLILSGISLQVRAIEELAENTLHSFF